MDIVNGGGKWQCCHFLNDERTIGCQFDLKWFFFLSFTFKPFTMCVTLFGK